MSIRRKLILSNIAMVVIPVILFILAVFLVISLLFGGFNDFWSVMNDEESTDTATIDLEFNELKKLASLSPDQLEDQQQLIKFKEDLAKHHSSLIVRKENKILFRSSELGNLSVNDLPAFGNDSFQRPVQWIDGEHYRLRSYDFYFDNGTEGTIFLLQDPGGNFGRGFFPLLFGILLLILIGTNGLLTYLVSRSIIKPVNELIKASNRISEGALDFEIVNKKKDELGELSRTFDHMRKKLKESIRVQLKYEENRKELVANISHDLKTPITSIKGYIEGIQEGVANTPEKMNRYLKTIYTKANDMDYLIDELSYYSKLDLNRLPYDFEELDIRLFLLDLKEELAFDLEQDGVELSFQADNDRTYHVLADREKIKRVVANIINNSLKYMDKPDKCITIRLNEEQNQVMVQIVDNGSGIPDNALPYIFDRFYRAEPSRNTSSGGSGLGLAIVKRIIEDHKGEVWAESKIGEGTGIHFTLPKVKGKEAKNE
ncbi:sensor histidine kinase [Pseudalkalibacillus salsuginis]|uniref:sensor histidine kinase n=1 Tax=Pseudalkalibacillus salsuginis TaxID=2910972 RepID=UPI001F265328|nr:HAMP domain-containing sensor histidine kinase [Pseudalkalibacillus salsuginis]MCF6409436.1 HAMP domain-containing histidine kinase [Pseudalkalibacillus salsuginis]